jgi:hypothetical protein
MFHPGSLSNRRHDTEKCANSDCGYDAWLLTPRAFTQAEKTKEEEKIEIPDEVVRKTKVKIQVVDGFDAIWTSEGTGARAKVGFWRPHTKVSARKANSK